MKKASPDITRANCRRFRIRHATRRLKTGVAAVFLFFQFGPVYAAESTGTHKILGVRVLFADASDAPGESSINSLLQGAKGHFARFSYDKLTLNPEVATVTLNNNRATYSNAEMKSAAETKLTNMGYKLGSYEIIGFYPGGGSFGSHATVGGSQFVSSSNGGSTLHEMGHTFGFKHQSVWLQSSGGPGPLARGDFQISDPFHFMSGSSSITPSGVDPEPYEKWQRGWITGRYKVDSNGSYTYRIYTFDQKETDSANDKRTLEVERGGGKDGSVWCGYRSELLENNQHLNQGLVLHWQPGGATTSSLIDAHPWSGYGPYGTSNHALQPGETWSDPPGEIHITNLGNGGTDPNKYIDVQVNRGSFSNNQAPAPTWDAPDIWTTGTPLTITVTGNDPDGDAVACMWETSNRNRPHNTSSNVLTATFNNDGYYDVKVTVSDMKGMTAKKSKTILVRPANAETRTWDRGAGDNKWSQAANWTKNILPAISDSVIFDGRTDPYQNVNVDGSKTVFDVEFSGSMKHYIQSDNVTSAGRTLTIQGGVFNNSSINQVFRYNTNGDYPLYVKLGNSGTFGDHVFNAANNDILIRASLSGSGASLIKTGPNELGFYSASTENAPNSYDGLTTIREGTLALEKNDGVNAIVGDIVIGDGTGTDILVLRSNNQVANTSLISFDGAGATFRLNGNNEVVGGIISLSEGSGVIENNSTASSVLTVNNDDDNDFHGIIRNGNSGGLALVKTGTGTLRLHGTSTYSGGTTISEGSLLAENSAGSATGSGPVQVDAGATLGGSGVIAGPVTISAGAILAPGTVMGALTISNLLDLQGTTFMEIGRVDGTVSNDQLIGVSNLTCGGVLQVQNIGTGILLAGDSFQLFSANTITGDFSSVVLPPLWPGLDWDSSTLAVDGTLRVTGSIIPPRFNALELSETNAAIALEGSGGSPGFAYTIFSSTNLIEWNAETSELFDDTGAFRIDLLTDPEQPCMYYMLEGQATLPDVSTDP